VNDPDPLTPAEARLANDNFLASRRKYGGDETRSLQDFLQIWAHVVDRVERGYTGFVADYQNALTYRDALEEVRLAVPPTIAAKLTAMLQPLDARFLDATQEMMRPLFPDRLREREFWWFRAPRKLAFSNGSEEYARIEWAFYVPGVAFTFVNPQGPTTRPDEIKRQNRTP
jgi:hypothetical protein